MKVALDILEPLVNKAPLDLPDLSVFQDLLVKKEEMLKNLLVVQDLKVPVVVQVQLDLPVLPELMHLLVNLVHKDLKVVQVLQAHKVIKDLKVKLVVKADQVVMPIIVHAQPEMLMPVVAMLVAAMVAHTSVSKSFSPLIYEMIALLFSFKFLKTTIKMLK
jgi:hypothetical protein